MDSATPHRTIPTEFLVSRFEGPLEDSAFGSGAQVSGLDSILPYSLLIRDRSGNLSLLRPNAAQQQYARQRSTRNIILKARQLGMTTYEVPDLLVQEK